MHILSPETDNCPSWISGRERMIVENISWSISTKECCRPQRGLNPRPPGLQSDGASNWATEAGQKTDKKDHYRRRTKKITIAQPEHSSGKLTRGPWATACSPEWHGHCRYADAMQHFSYPIITTKEKIIIWVVLSFEEEYIWAWQSIERDHLSQLNVIIWINYLIATVGSMWNLVEIG